MNLWLAALCIITLTPQQSTPQRIIEESWSGRQGGEDARQQREQTLKPVPVTPSDDFGEPPLEPASVTMVPAEARYDYPSPSYRDVEYYDEAQERDYKHSKPKKCYPHTVTKYKTVYKDRKANVYNKVEVRNPRPQVHKTKETRHTTIRYPVFITQVIKPLLTQVETKVKPMFFTKTLKRIKTIVFTVTGIGQVTVTSVKYEKEYVTRCQKKKGYGHDHGHGGGYDDHHGGGYHRRDDDIYEPEYVDEEYAYSPPEATARLRTYEDLYSNRRTSSRAPRSITELMPSFVEDEVPQKVSEPHPVVILVEENL